MAAHVQVEMGEPEVGDEFFKGDVATEMDVFDLQLSDLALKGRQIPFEALYSPTRNNRESGSK